MASAGLGVALLPEPLMQRMKTRGLSTAKLAKSGMQWEVGHIWQQSGYLSLRRACLAGVRRGARQTQAPSARPR